MFHSASNLLTLGKSLFSNLIDVKKSNGFPHFTATSCCGSGSSTMDPDLMGSLDLDTDLDLGG
jgi:hypothetical protein